MSANDIGQFYSLRNRETTKAVDAFLLKNFTDNPEIFKHIKRRKETSPTKIKSFFIRIGFEIGNDGKKDWKEIVPLCAMCELLNIGNYLIEQSIDEPDEAKAKLGYKIRKLVLGSNLQGYEKKIFKDMIAGIDEYLRLDNAVLLWDNKIEKDDFFKIYEKKCSLVGGQFYAHCLELGFRRSGKSSKASLKYLKNIGQIFGTAYQMVHEVADLLPERLKRFPEDFKYYQKQYNSLRKHKLTLPIYLGLFEWNGFNKKEFFKLVEKGDYEEITNVFLKEKIIKRAKRFINNYGKNMNAEFKKLDPSRWVDCLHFATGAINSNIFWKHFKKLYQEEIELVHMQR